MARPTWPNSRSEPQPGKIEHGVRVLGHLGGIADHRDDAAVLDVEQRARGLLRQAARHRLVDEVDHLRDRWRPAGGGRRPARLLLRQAERFRHPVREALRLVAPVDHELARELDGASDRWR